MERELVRQKMAVVVSRQWHNPKISIDVNVAGIAIAMTLDDFLQALAAEYGSPASTLTRAQHLARLHAAAAVVTDSMKRESSPHVG